MKKRKLNIKISVDGGVNADNIEKLENANMFKVIRTANAQKKNCNQYQFQQLKEFEMFSDEFLDASELTNKVKAYWIMLQSEAYKDTTNSLAYISKNDKELSESLNLDLRTVQKYNKELECPQKHKDETNKNEPTDLKTLE